MEPHASENRVSKPTGWATTPWGTKSEVTIWALREVRIDLPRFPRLP